VALSAVTRIPNMMEEEIKWIHDGGLNNPAQTVAQ
jgi:hypothetical protein